MGIGWGYNVGMDFYLQEYIEEIFFFNIILLEKGVKVLYRKMKIKIF